MKILFLIAIGFAILAVTVAPPPKSKTVEVGIGGPRENAQNTNAGPLADPEPEIIIDGDEGISKSKKITSSEPAKKRTNKGVARRPKLKKDPTRKQTENDFEIKEDLADILREYDDGHDYDYTDGQIEIPTPDQLSNIVIDPINLARKIKNVADPSEKRTLEMKLKTAIDQNEDKQAGKYYRAAYAALIDENRAADFWDRQLNRMATEMQRTTLGGGPLGYDLLGKIGNSIGIGGNSGTSSGFGSSVASAMGGTIANTLGVGSGLGLLSGMSGLGSGISSNIASSITDSVGRLTEADPLGTLLRRRESKTLNALSDVSTRWGKMSDFTHDTVQNVSKRLRATTFPGDSIPIIKNIKSNLLDYIEDTATRNKFIAGALADTASAILKEAANDADKQAEKREKLLQQVSPIPLPKSKSM